MGTTIGHHAGRSSTTGFHECELNLLEGLSQDFGLLGIQVSLRLGFDQFQMIDHHLGGLQVGREPFALGCGYATEDIENVLGLNHDELDELACHLSGGHRIGFLNFGHTA